MRSLIGFSLLVSLAGCSAADDAVKVCEGELLKTLRSPSTYSRQEALTNSPAKGSAFWTVMITYDADNAFGTPVRGSYFCAFKAGADGQLPSRTALEGAAMDARLDAIDDSIGGKPEQSAAEALYPCCLSRDDRKAFIAAGLQ